MTSSEDDPRTPFREWPAAGRWVVYLVIAALAAGLVGAVGMAALVRRSFPMVDGTVSLGRLSAPAEIRRDRLGVPHVVAEDARDLFLAQGYAQAQDRFFAMDAARHRAAGRLAELVGESAVGSDVLARTFGWQRLADAEYPALAPTTKSYLRAFSAGVNAYLREHTPSRLSLEYTLLEVLGLNYKPRPWAPSDSLAILKAAGSDWQDDIDVEVERARLSVDRTAAQIEELYPAGVDEAPGDAFAVSGAHTASGKPILADSLIVAPSAPSPWSQVGLRCAEVTPTCPFDVSGATLDGVPGVLAGRNARVAWGLARSSADVADLFLERVEGASYRRGKKMIALAERSELIRIQGAPSRTLVVRSTTAGPLLSDVSSEVAGVGANVHLPAGAPGAGYAVALAATALAPAHTADAVFALGRATSADEVSAASADLALPGSDLVYADDGGRIGRIELGPLPVRSAGRTGRDATPAWRSGGWPARRPGTVTVTDPASGVVGAPRVLAAVGRGGDWTAARLTRIQADTTSPLARTLVPRLLVLLTPSRYYADGQRLLAGWDREQGAGSAAAAYFNAVWANLLRLTFHDQLKASLWPDGGPRWIAIVERLLDDPHSTWWDDVSTDGTVEDRDTILAEALRDARDDLTRTVARETGGWSWGALLRVPLENGPLGPRDLDPFERLVDRGPSPAGGGPGTLSGTTYDAAAGFRVTRAAAVRLLADLGDPDGSRWVSLTGASGHLFAEHYRDQQARWTDGRAFAWPVSAAAVGTATGDVLRLRPRR